MREMTDLAAAAHGVEPVGLICAISPLNALPHLVHFSDGVVRPLSIRCLAATRAVRSLSSDRTVNWTVNKPHATSLSHFCTRGAPALRAFASASSVTVGRRHLRGHLNLAPGRGARQRLRVLKPVFCVAATADAVAVAAIVVE